MYQKKNRNFSWEKFFKVFFIIVIILVSGLYIVVTSVLMNLRNDMGHFFDGFDVESSLVEEKYVDYDLLDLRAQQFEDLLGIYHIPYNMTGDGWDYYPPVSVCFHYSTARFHNNSELLATFDPLDETSPYNDKNNMTYCGDRAHTALYEGVYTAGVAFRYAVAKRNNDARSMKEAKERIWLIVKGYELLSNVSKDSAFVRYAIPNTTKAYKMFPGHWNPTPVAGQEYTPTNDHYIVEYKGYKWSLSRHLSRDVSIGIMFALSMIYTFVDDAEIRAKVGHIIDKSVNYWYNSKWRIIDTDGTQQTSGDFIGSRPLIDGSSILTFLQMGKMVNPEKWGPVYYHYAYDRDLANTIGRSMRIGVDLAPKVMSGYYGCNFVYNNAPTLIFLEKDPVLREKYIKNWLNVIHDFTKLHRNANFDVVWLLCHTEISDDIYDVPTIKLNDYDIEIWKNANIEKPTDKTYIEEFCVRDIKDCLMRYAIRRYPNRNFHWATEPGTFPNVHQQPIENFKYPEYDYWNPDSSSTGLIDSVLSLIEGGGSDGDMILNNSLPVDMRKTEDLMFQRQSFTLGATQAIYANPGTFQVPAGPEYLSVYWMAKYLELF